ncbi:MAG: right-handed parallel beta-helix repeat-containing protein [Flavobacteriales bacterium]|nr:right-handed parallel beta-helix repeat-containing protein [Flavobacteriales bacterium]
MKLFARTLAAIFLLVPLFGHAVVYYVSPSGNDSNNGTSQATPWRTIARVNTLGAGINAGDQVLFQRGGTYRGRLNVNDNGTTTSRIVYGAYGTGAAPVISGSLAVTNWVQFSGNIWRAQVGQKVHQVYFNDQMQTQARFPNTGWLRTDVANSTSTTDSDLNQASGYWVGATAVIRTTNWSYDTAYVTAFNSGVLTHTATGNNLGSQQWGYFLRNKLALLDAAGEWYYEPSSGFLYFWCPANANPNTQLVEAAVTDFGIYFGWQRNNVLVTDLAFKHQVDASIRMSGTFNVEVMNCTITDTQRAIYSTGSDQNFHHNTFARTFHTAVYLLDNNSQFNNNVLTDIALHPGLGENNWGYFALRTNGTGMVIRDNRVEHVGYIAMALAANALVEGNVVRYGLQILNDGGGIAIDNTDGMVMRKNIVMDMIGEFESVAPQHTSYFPISHGIYFGNISIKNTLVEQNTVANCKSSGIHVDHTMVSTGNQVKDNVLYNNGVQLSISDFSNYNTPGATAPFHVQAFNTIYSGNVLYCLTKDQLCMKQLHVYGNNWVDYGTFTNNRYFNPYNELSILRFNTFAGFWEYHTLERWQSVTGKDVGSTRSPLRQSAMATASELSGNLIINGTFNTNVTGWAGWPNNATATWVNTHLDNGALRAFIPNNSVYYEYNLRNPDQFQMQNGQWYRMRFSIVAPNHGILQAAVKGVTQLTGPNTIIQRDIPFSTERRDLEIYFQSNLSDQALLQFTNNYLMPMYYLDNVQLHRVTVTPLDPTQDHVLLYNDQATAQTVALPAGCWHDVTGTLQPSSITLQPYMSRVVYRVTGAGCSVPVANTVGAKMFLGGAINWTTMTMRDDLRAAGLVPTSEPYTALGLTVANAGATVPAATLQTTGAQAVVDWVVLELRNNNAGYTVAERRAALLRANGDVTAVDGSVQIPFTTTTAGKFLVVRHRNHLGVVAQSPIGVNGQVVDFTQTSTVIYGVEPTQVNGARRALWPGDTNMDGTVRYTGQDNDRDPILNQVGGVVPTNTTTGYNRYDINMDGVVKYSGIGNDRDVVLQIIGGVVPTTVRAAQLP